MFSFKKYPIGFIFCIVGGPDLGCVRPVCRSGLYYVRPSMCEFVSHDVAVCVFVLIVIKFDIVLYIIYIYILCYSDMVYTKEKIQHAIY